MEAVRTARIAGLLGGLVLVIATEAMAVEGRYVGSLYHTPGTVDFNTMRHLLDMGSRSTVYGGADLQLWFNLAYSSRPGMSGADLLQGRVSADLRKSIFRARALVEPWQDAAPGASPPRKRAFDLRFDMTPRRGPNLQVDLRRSDRDARLAGRSKVEDKRIRMAYPLPGGGMGLGYRNIMSGPDSAGADTRKVDEWRGDIRKNWIFPKSSVMAGYDGLLTQTRFRERETNFSSHRFNLGGRWVPIRRLILGGTATGRFGKSEDNVMDENRKLNERYFSGRARYTVFQGFDASLVREYRTQGAASTSVSDYWQVQAQLRREIVRGTEFHVGLSRTVDLVELGGASPKNSGFVILDGWLQRALAFRLESRLAWRSDIEFRQTQWYRVAQLRTYPTSATRVELNYRGVSQPELLGVNQEDTEWYVVAGYRPSVDVDLTGSYRWLNGVGRVNRQERFGTLLVAWNMTRATNLSVNWSRRKTVTNGISFDETVANTEIRFRMPRRLMLRATWQYVAGLRRPDANTYGLVLEKNF